MIDITPTTKAEGASRTSDSLDINAAIDTQATQILDAIGGKIEDEARAQSLLAEGTARLAALYPANRRDDICAALVKVLNARLLEQE